MACNPPASQPPLTPPRVVWTRRMERAMYDFHVRAFGEELARINFLPLEERCRAVGEMVDHARRKGVNLTRPARGFP